MLAVRAPQSKPAIDSLLDPESVHQVDDVQREGRLLTVALCLVRDEACGAVAAQMGNDRAVAPGREKRRNLHIGVYVVGPAVQQDDRGPVRRPEVDIADIEQSSGDLPDRSERGRSLDACGLFRA